MTMRPQALVRTLLATAAVAALAAPMAGATGPAPGQQGATTVTGVTEPARPAFYEPPAHIPAPGRVLRTEPATSLLDPLGLSSLTVTSTRIMYSSKASGGEPIAVTGTLYVPRTPWIGWGNRPLISYAPGTQGMADRCAPSRQIAEGFLEYEYYLIQAFIARGYAVVLTDYQGLGTPGTHPYMMRVSQARAVLDAARAAKLLPGLTSTSPVGVMGYSQGGGAAAAAAELAPTYAPDLAVKGVVAGAVPADLAAVGENLDGSLYAAFLAYGVIGMAEENNLPPAELLNEEGLSRMASVENSCVAELLSFSFKKSEEFTRDGRPVSAYYTEAPFAKIIADNRIGRRTPAVPVRLVHSALDDVIPYAVGRQLMRDWCARGANVVFSTNAVPLHLGGMAPHIAESLAFFEARFAGLPQISNCWLYR